VLIRKRALKKAISAHSLVVAQCPLLWNPVEIS